MANGVLGIDFARVAVQGGTGAVSGAVQRWLWEKNDTSGFLGTGAAVALGLLGKSFLGGGRMMDDVFDALLISGATIAGWMTTERVLVKSQQAFSGGGYQAGLHAPVTTPAQARAISAAAAVGGNGVAPRASFLGLNENTGESIRGSRI